MKSCAGRKGGADGQPIGQCGAVRRFGRAVKTTKNKILYRQHGEAPNKDRQSTYFLPVPVNPLCASMRHAAVAQSRVGCARVVMVQGRFVDHDSHEDCC